jgi:leader peptidase (prepilin peptidase)/N-methyltransferase
VALALVYCMVIAGFIAATFIDVEHYIIPDEITIGGAVAGIVCSLLLPRLHGQSTATEGVLLGLLGLGIGAGVIYSILRIGKWLFGRQRLRFRDQTRMVFTETTLHLADREIPFEELFYRQSDVVALQASTVELADRCYRDVLIRLSPEALQIGEERFNPAEVPWMEAVSAEVVLPREAMGLGDVKFMAAIGAFLGWQAVIFSLMLSSIIGSIVGITLIVLRRQAWSSRLPYGPYIALAATIWIFCGRRLVNFFFGG